MKKALIPLFVLVAAAFDLSAQSLGSLILPSGTEELAMGGFCRNRFSSNRTLLSASLWGPSSIEAKYASLDQTLNFGNWSIDLAGKTFINKSYDIISSTGMPSGIYTPYDLSVSLGIGRKIGSAFFVGAAGRYCFADVAKQFSGSSFCLDLNAEYVFENGLVGVSLKNLGPKILIGRHYNNLPITLAAGGFWTTGGLKIAAEADYLFLENGFMGTAGLSYKLFKFLSVSGGYHFSLNTTALPNYASAALRFEFSGFEISGACLFASPVLTPTPCVSLGYNW